MRFLHVLALVLVVSAVGCAQQVPSVSDAPTPEFATATLPPTAAPSITSTSAPAAPANTTSPLIGTTTTQLNIRAQPQASATLLGIIPAAATVQVIGRTPGDNWYQILYEGSTGWASSQYLTLTDKGNVPIAGGNGLPLMGSVREQIFVRTGPGTGFETVGTQSARDVVQLVGRDVAGAWLQIEFTGGPEGKGWVAASFLEGAQFDALPIIAESGEVLGTATPTGTVPVPTPSVAPAREDDDSAERPSVDVAFSPSGIGSILYHGEVSAPEGDMVDWVRFQPYRSEVAFGIECAGNSTVSLQLQRDSHVVESGSSLACGRQMLLNLETRASPYTLRIAANTVGNTLVLIRYRLRIANSP